MQEDGCIYDDKEGDDDQDEDDFDCHEDGCCKASTKKKVASEKSRGDSKASS